MATSNPGTDVSISEHDALVRRAMEQVRTGKITLDKVIEQLAGSSLPAAPEPAAPERAPDLSMEVLDALRELPELWGDLVVPAQARKMTGPESAAMARLRLAIDAIIGPLGKAKDSTIRTAAANHLNAVAEAAGLAHPEDVTEIDPETGKEVLVAAATPRDAKGNYVLKQYDPIPGTGHRWERRVSEGGVKISSARIKEAYDAGRLTREQYLAVTSVPEVPRQFDPEKARKAIVKDPALLAVLAEHGATVSQPSTSIYLTKDK